MRNGIQNGIPFPDIYEWTVGEIIDYSRCKHKARKEELREEALMYYRTASLVARMVGCVFSSNGKSKKFNVMDEYSWLWSNKERTMAQIESKIQEFRSYLMSNSVIDNEEGGNIDA